MTGYFGKARNPDEPGVQLRVPDTLVDVWSISGGLVVDTWINAVLSFFFRILLSERMHFQSFCGAAGMPRGCM